MEGELRVIRADSNDRRMPVDRRTDFPSSLPHDAIKLYSKHISNANLCREGIRMPEITETRTEQETATVAEEEGEASPQAESPIDWHNQDNPYRGKKAIDSAKVFKILLAVVLVGIVAVVALLATRILGHRETLRQTEVEPAMQETKPTQDASFERPLLSKPQPEGQPVAVDAGDDGTTREFLSTVDVYEEIPVAKATGIQPEGDAVSDLRGRGLVGRTDAGTGVSAMYDMDGTYRREWTARPATPRTPPPTCPRSRESYGPSPHRTGRCLQRRCSGQARMTERIWGCPSKSSSPRTTPS